MEQTEGELESRLSKDTDYSKKGLELSRKPIKSDCQKNFEERGWQFLTNINVEEKLRNYAKDKKILEYLIDGCEVKSDKDYGVKIEDVLKASDKNKKIIYRKTLGLLREDARWLYTEKKVRLARAYDKYTGKRISSEKKEISIYVKDRE